MRAWCFLLCLMISGCANTTRSVRSEAQRDAESYAIASCLWYQQQPYLKDQGSAWAGAIVQSTEIELDALGGIAEAVRRKTAKGGMVVVRSESKEGSGTKDLPILYCVEIPDRPSIRAEIEKAVSALVR